MDQRKGQKKPYTKPTLTVHGDLTAITRGAGFGESMDLAFPMNLPRPGSDPGPHGRPSHTFS